MVGGAQEHCEFAQKWTAVPARRLGCARCIPTSSISPWLSCRVIYRCSILYGRTVLHRSSVVNLRLLLDNWNAVPIHVGACRGVGLCRVTDLFSTLHGCFVLRGCDIVELMLLEYIRDAIFVK